MIKIFSDRAYLSQDEWHAILLYPFWGKNEDKNDRGRYDQYEKIGGQFFQMTTLDEADIAILPQRWERVIKDLHKKKRAEDFLEKARKNNKPSIIFYWSDFDDDIPYNDIIVFRTSLYQSSRRPYEFAMPAWSEDFVSSYLEGKLPIRVKQKKPVVGFCGLAGPVKKSRFTEGKEYLRRLLFRLGIHRYGQAETLTAHQFRTKALQILSKSKQIETNFIVRDRFLGGGASFSERLEYVQNMNNSDYVLCARGVGNFSYRLYETLSCGRIPVFINTDCVLPYDSEINWKDYCVWVEAGEINRIADKVIEFHERISEQEFLEIQRRCRAFWEEYISPEGFFKNFYRHLDR